MAELLNGDYNRAAAAAYAKSWAYGRNPKYYNFDGIGGDCTNFVSQCLYAGTETMNYTPTYGWFYVNINKRSPAWSSVKHLYNFLTRNQGLGPYGREVKINEVQTGDIAQLIINEQDYQHTTLITSAGNRPNLNNVLVAAHTYDCNDRPLSTYAIKEIRFVHIDGFRHL